MEKIDLNRLIFYLKDDYVTAGYTRGSILYGTNDKDSDNDNLFIFKDNVEFVDYQTNDCVKADKRILQISFGKIDDEVVKHSDFLDLIDEHNPLAIEAIFSYGEKSYPPNEKYLKHFKLDKWKLRQSFGGVANNSFVKAKKKLTVKKDYDRRCGVKSLFHSIRLLMFACQIAEYGKINDFKCCIPLWDEIKTDSNNGFVWDDFKKKYKPIWNEWHSKMVKLCPRPESFFHNK